MKIYKPYVSLSKKISKYELEVIVSAVKDQTIAGIRQEEILKDNTSFWGVIITLSNATRLVNGPENPVFSTIVDIALDKSASYKKILCQTVISPLEGSYGPSEGGSTSIDFEDVNT